MSTELYAPRTWREFVHSRFTGQDPRRPRMDKIEVYDYLSSHGFPCPEIYRRFDRPADIDLEGLPVKFVLKPTVLASMRGVMVLERDPSGNYYDSISKKKLTIEQIIEVQEKWHEIWKEKRNGKYQIIVEERAYDESEDVPIPYDYKFYAFNGKVPYITQVNRNKKKTEMAWFDHEFKPVAPEEFVESSWSKIVPGEHRIPKRAQEMLELVKRVSLSLKTPFVSVDCFSSSRGPLIGELTFAAGGPYYGGMFTLTDRMNHLMGQLWSDAAIELGQEIPMLKPGPIPKVWKNGKLPSKIK